MVRRRMFAALAGVGAVVILGGVALAAATQGGTDVAPAHAAGHHHAGPGLMVPGAMPHGLLGRLAGQLALSPEQQQTIHGLFDQARPGFEQLHRQMRAGAELLARTGPDDPAYQTVVASVSQQAADTAAQFVLQSSQLRSQVNGVLTPAQRTKLTALEADLRARMLERHHFAPAASATPQGS